MNSDMLFTEPSFSPAACKKLISFYKEYQNKNWLFFLHIRKSWAALHPENPLRNALCANINSITGEFRPVDEQKIWCWGDGRALGIWSYALLTNAIPENLREEYLDYCKSIFEGTIARYEINKGVLPISADPHTGKADNHPWNKQLVEGVKTFSNLFTVTGWVNYGILTRNDSVIKKGINELAEVLEAIEKNLFIAGPTKNDTTTQVHGPRMIALGVTVEILKSVNYIGETGKIVDDAKALSIKLITHILDNHYNADNGTFWEKSDLLGNPVIINGTITVDPGHATEFAGFIAEAVSFIPDEWSCNKWNRNKFIKAALACHLFAQRIGFSKAGAMYKAVDLITCRPLPDFQAVDANGRLTAPWWNVREHCAAALKLFLLTQDDRLVESYRKAQWASYKIYPNSKIMDQMVQTVDPETLFPLDIAPATGNLDPMHDTRARLREIEVLEKLLSF